MQPVERWFRKARKDGFFKKSRANKLYWKVKPQPPTEAIFRSRIAQANNSLDYSHTIKDDKCVQSIFKKIKYLDEDANMAMNIWNEY